MPETEPCHPTAGNLLRQARILTTLLLIGSVSPHLKQMSIRHSDGQYSCVCGCYPIIDYSRREDACQADHGAVIRCITEQNSEEVYKAGFSKLEARPRGRLKFGTEFRVRCPLRVLLSVLLGALNLN